MLFYSIFVLFFFGKRLFLVASIAWAAAIIARPLAADSLAPLFSTLLNPINLEFMFGMICALLYRKTSRFTVVSAWAALTIGAAIASQYFFVATGEGSDRLLF